MSKTQISQPAAQIRESWKVLPRCIQRALTTLSGKPYLGQPAYHLTPGTHFLWALMAVGGGLALGVVGPLFGGPWWFLVPFGWILLVHGARKSQVLVLHHASHMTFASRRLWLNKLVGEAISIGLQIQAFETYRKEHLRDHHSKNHMSKRDPTVVFLFHEVGLQPGLPPRKSWRRLFLALMSPGFHLRLLARRLWSNIGPAVMPLHRILSLTYLLTALVLVSHFGLWEIVLVALVVPLTVIYNICSTLRLCTEHRFPGPAVAGRRSRDALATFTSAIFLGDPAPRPDLPHGRRVAAWGWWCFRLLFVHLVGRLLIVPGDTPCHDLHHRRPSLVKWSDYLFERQHDVENLRPDEWPPYTETWGSVFTSIDEVFQSLERADPRDYRE